MKIKLVNCVFIEKRIFEPMGICYIAASLREVGYNVEIIDPRIKNYTIDDTVEYLLSDDFDILGLSVMSFYKSNVIELTRKIREKGFTGKIVLGGISPTICTELYLRECTDIDMVMCGDGELIWTELAQVIKDETQKKIPKDSWKKILGIAYKGDNNQIIFNRGRTRITDLDKLPFMARDILEENINTYGKEKMFVPILSSRGCYGRCSYCWISAALDTQEGLRYRQRSVKSVVDEIEFLYHKYGVIQFSFEDDNFITPGVKGLERAIEFRNLLKERELKIFFSFQTRPDTVTSEIIEIYKEAGLVKPYIGIESILDDAVSVDKRGESITYAQQIENVLTIFSKLGYEPDIGRENYMELKFGYITFHPETTVYSFKKSVQFFKKHKLTPKRLVKKMNLIDGDMDVQQNLLESENFDGTTSYDFKDIRVSYIYSYMMEFSEKIFNIREQIRSIEKHIFFSNVSKEEIYDLVEFRKTCDENIYNFGEKIVDIIEAVRDIEEIKKQLKTLLEKELDAFNNDIYVKNIQDKINDANFRFGVDVMMYDLYW